MATFYQRNNRSQLFIEKKRSYLSVVVLLFFCVFLIFTDSHYHTFTSLRKKLSVISGGIQYIGHYPLRMVGWVQSVVAERKHLVYENTQLRYERMMLESQLQKMLFLRRENLELRALLSADASNKMRTAAAEILAVDTGDARQIMVLNKGARDGVYLGQAVLDAKGIVGQIVDVGYMTSALLLISDVRSAVPVKNNRTGERAILTGTNDINRLSLINLPNTSLVQKGDLMVSSGLGRRYPEGYPVGRVERVDRQTGEDFITVDVNPIASLNRNHVVLLVWPNEQYLALNNQIKERIRNLEDLGT